MKKKKKTYKKKILKVVGGTDTREHEAQSNIQLTKHNRNAEIQNNLPSQATLGFHLPQLPRASMDSWEAGKQLSSSFNQKLSSYHKMDANFQYTNPCDSWFLLNLKRQMCKRKLAVINRVPGAWGPSHRLPDFHPKLQGSKTDKSRSRSVSEIWMHDTVNVSHVHSYNFWECFGCQ